MIIKWSTTKDSSMTPYTYVVLLNNATLEVKETPEEIAALITAVAR